MDMSFANQALSVEYMVKNYKTLEKKVYKVPDDLDKRVAKLKLESMGIKIDKLTPEQEEYLAGWSEGTFQFSVPVPRGRRKLPLSYSEK